MRRPLPLLLCLLLPLFAAMPTTVDETKISSTIRSATVYLEGAQVNRRAEATVPSGRSTLVFTGLTTDLDKGSVQVSAADAEVQILSVSHRLNFAERPAATPREQALRARITALDKRTRRLRTEAAIAQEEEAILKENRKFVGTESGLDADDLIRGVEYHRERLTAIKLQYLVLEDSLTAVADRRETLQKELAQLGKSQEQKATGEVVVVTQTERAVRTAFTVSYLVPNAGWSPVYDVRVQDVATPVDLRYRARVRQQSGEPWDNINLTLSTGDPTLNAEAPELPVWRITNNSRPPVYRPKGKKEVAFAYGTVSGLVTDASGEPLIGVNVSIPGTAVGTVTDIDGTYRLTVPEGSRSLRFSYTGFNDLVKEISGPEVDAQLEEGVLLDEVVVTGYGRENKLRLPRVDLKRERAAAAPPPPPVAVAVERRATTVAFVIELPYSIPSDGSPRNVEIQQHTVSTQYSHFAVPKLSPAAYLTATLTDWEQYNLISGDVQLFFEGTYLGESYLDIDSNTNDTLDISLGRDPGVIVTRTRDTDYRKRAFLSGKQTDSRGWRIRVRNTKQQPINLTVMDQVPISGQSNIEVETDLPTDVVLQEQRGFLTWQLDLAPREAWTTQFGYAVKYPKGMRIYLE